MTAEYVSKHLQSANYRQAYLSCGQREIVFWHFKCLLQYKYCFPFLFNQCSPEVLLVRPSPQNTTSIIFMYHIEIWPIY